MDSEALLKLAQDSLDDLKARDMSTLDVRSLTSVTDYLVIASGTSDRHVSSLADNVIRCAKEAGVKPIGIEGQDAGEGTDFNAIEQGAASVTPLKVDLTRHEAVTGLSDWLAR